MTESWQGRLTPRQVLGLNTQLDAAHASNQRMRRIIARGLRDLARSIAHERTERLLLHWATAIEEGRIL